MKVEIKIDTAHENTTVVINTPKMTPELLQVVEMLEGIDINPLMLTAKLDDKSYFIDPKDAEIFRAEDGYTIVYTKKRQRFIVPKTLTELSDILNNNFIRISKSAIINITCVEHISPYFNGTMSIATKSGVKDYISRGYLGAFKERLGL
jgi:DNA-binding LytR/AlgR family response regulator